MSRELLVLPFFLALLLMTPKMFIYRASPCIQVFSKKLTLLSNLTCFSMGQWLDFSNAPGYINLI